MTKLLTFVIIKQTLMDSVVQLLCINYVCETRKQDVLRTDASLPKQGMLLSLNDAQTRDGFKNFLEVIESLAEISGHKCKTSVTAMKEWLINGHCAGDENPPSSAKELWWDSPWYLNLANIYSFTMFHGVDNKD